MSREVDTMSSPALAALCGNVIDYAGTFPPAKLPLADALDSYDRYRKGADATMLNRFIISARDLAAFEELARARGAGARWPLGVVCAAADDIELALAWSSELAAIESLELRATITPAKYAGEVFVERPLQISRDELEALAKTNSMLKIRLGGESTPSASEVARMLSLCAELGISLKATAGLHQAIRSDSHGFLNLLLAATLAHQGGGIDDLEAVLDETEAASFRFDVDGAAWRHHRFDIEAFAGARRLFRSFGSCSFEEPLESLEALGLRTR